MVSQPSLNLSNLPVAVGVDGHTINMREAGFGDIIFFQIANQDERKINGIGVSTVRLTVSQLVGLKNAIDDVLSQHEKAMVSKNKTSK